MLTYQGDQVSVQAELVPVQVQKLVSKPVLVLEFSMLFESLRLPPHPRNNIPNRLHRLRHHRHSSVRQSVYKG